MNGLQIKEFTTELLAGDVMGDQVFYNLLNIAKQIVEGKRSWRVLLTKAQYPNISGTDVSISMPEDAWDYPVGAGNAVLGITSSGSKYLPLGAKFAQLELYKGQDNYFTMDHKNRKIWLLGNVPQMNVTINYFGYSPDITDSTEWLGFPKNGGRLLAYIVSAFFKGGIDYDDIYARMAPENRSIAELLMFDLVMWDDRLQRMELGY